MISEAIIPTRVKETNINEKDEFINLIESTGVHFIPPEKTNLPKEYDFSKNEGNPRIIEYAIDSFTNYLHYPIIKDDFKKHSKRDKWRSMLLDQIREMEGDEKAMRFNKFLHENKMRMNAISFLFGWLDKLRDNGLPEKLATELSSSLTKTLDSWDGPTTEKKIRIIKEISDNVAAVVNYYGKK